MQIKPKLSSISLGLLAASFLLTSGVTFAANYKGESYKGDVAPMAPPCKILRDGWYLGIQAGYDSYSTRASNSGTVGPFTGQSNPVVAANGYEGGLFAGYGQYFDNFYYLAGEIFVNDSSASQSQSTGGSIAGNSFNRYLKTGAGVSYGISLLPGLKVNDSSLIYLRLGYERADLQGQTAGNVNGFSYASGSNWNYEGGFNYGIGLETAVYQNFSIRTEFNHTSYSSFSANNSAGTGTSFNPSDNQFTLGLNYHFA